MPTYIRLPVAQNKHPHTRVPLTCLFSTGYSVATAEMVKYAISALIQLS